MHRAELDPESILKVFPQLKKLGIFTPVYIHDIVRHDYPPELSESGTGIADPRTRRWAEIIFLGQGGDKSEIQMLVKLLRRMINSTIGQPDDFFRSRLNDRKTREYLEKLTGPLGINLDNLGFDRADSMLYPLHYLATFLEEDEFHRNNYVAAIFRPYAMKNLESLDQTQMRRYHSLLVIGEITRLELAKELGINIDGIDTTT